MHCGPPTQFLGGHDPMLALQRPRGTNYCNGLKERLDERPVEFSIEFLIDTWILERQVRKWHGDGVNHSTSVIDHLVLLSESLAIRGHDTTVLTYSTTRYFRGTSWSCRDVRPWSCILWQLLTSLWSSSNRQTKKRTTRKRCTGQVLPSAKYRPKVTSTMNAPILVDAALRPIGKTRHGGHTDRS